MMNESQFWFGYFTSEYEATVAFYRDGLGFGIIRAWDRNPDDRGTLFRAPSGIIEVLALPDNSRFDPQWEDWSPQGAFIVIEVYEVEALYQQAVENGLVIQQGFKNKIWGRRSFCVRDPNGLKIYFFSELEPDKVTLPLAA